MKARAVLGISLVVLPLLACRPGARKDNKGELMSIENLAETYWQDRLDDDPIESTHVGDRRRDARVPDPRPESIARQEARLRGRKAQLVAVQPDGLSHSDRVNRAQLLFEIEKDLATIDCGMSQWSVDPNNGPQSALLSLGELQTVSDPASGAALVARWEKLGEYLDANTANLRRSLAQGKVAPRAAVSRVLRQLDTLLATPAADWPLAQPARTVHADWPEGVAQAFSAQVDRAVADKILPAWRRLADFLRDELLPVARDDAHAGLAHIPGGEACYKQMILVHTSMALEATEIHRYGLEEIARIDAEIATLGEKLFGTRSLTEIRAALFRPEGMFKTREQIEETAKNALARASAVLPKMLGKLPKTPCEVKRLQPFEEQDAPIAYYRQPSDDGSRPGAYHVNTFAPETRPRFEAEVLAFHESVPGHHVQIAIAQEMTGVPAFRRHTGVNAYVEGWALYTERLAQEWGLYSDDLSRLGMLSFDAWRASRLVVDTGLHALGWTRQAAIDFLSQHTLLADNNIANEVDRYIVWPGQALAYKIGQREMLSLRALAESKLGARFDQRTFHDAILDQGALSLGVLRAEIERWLERH